MSKNSWILNILVFVIAFLGCLLVTESAFRIFSPIYPSVYQPDDQLLYKLVPGSKKLYAHKKENGGRKIVVTINSLGFRGEEFLLEKTKKRVIVYGDSFIEGGFSPLENTFVKQLEKKLNAILTDRVEVINAGVNAYGPDQESLKMEQDLDVLKPDVVVVSIFAGNDFGDLIRDKIYTLTADNQLQLNGFSLNNAVRSEMMKAAFPQGVQRLQLAFRVKKTVWLLKSVIKRIYQRVSGDTEQLKYDLFEEDFKAVSQEYDEFVLKHNNEVTNLFNDHYDADIAFFPEAPSSLYKINLMEKVILRMRDTLAARRIPFIVLIVPSSIDVCDKYYYEVDQNKYPLYKRSRLTDILETITSKHGIKHINLFSFFRKNNPEQYYYNFPESHWNDFGQEQAAEIVQQLVISEKLL